jgi:cytochrome d ubiquinol oxidase subunit I
MNSPQGFTERDGKLVSVSRWKAMLNAATWPETVHMILAACLVSGFVAASVYAVAMLRDGGELIGRGQDSLCG